MTQRDDELAREIQAHLELDAEDRLAEGLTAAEARRQAHIAFGGVARTREDVRAVWVPVWVDALRRDLVYTWRTLVATPVFSVVTIVMLALGIGANTAIFSLMDQVLLRSLPVRDPGQLVMFENPGIYQGFTNGNDDEVFSVPMFRALHDASGDLLDGLAARFTVAVTASADTHADRVVAEVVSGEYFGVLGVAPTIGRTLDVRDDRLVDGHPVVVLAHDYWSRRFAQDPAVVGRPLVINGTVMTIVGVAAPGFAGMDPAAPADIFVPLLMKRGLTPTRDDLASWRARWVTLTGRLTPGVSIDAVAASLQAAYRQSLLEDVKTARLDPNEHEQFIAKTLVLTAGGRGLSSLREQFSTVLIALMGMVGLVLLIACANVANLLLARAASRQHEVAIRLALGAGRFRLARQRLTEAGLLTGAGALVGLLVAALTTRVLIDMLPFPGARLLASAPDLRVMAFAAGAAALTVVIAGLWPALQGGGPTLALALKDESGKIAGGTRAAHARRGLVIAQVGLSVILLAGAGLFVRSLSSLRTSASGVATDHLLQFRIDLASSGYPFERAKPLVGDLLSRLRAIPGVMSASSANVVAFSGGNNLQTVRVDGYQNAPGENMNPRTLTIGPDYFSTLGVPIVAGRDFNAFDASPAGKVAIINETMARYFWKDQNPLGRRFRRPSVTTPGSEWEVVGVVKDMKFASMRDKPMRAFFVPYMQADTLASVVMYMKYRGDLESVSAAARQAVKDLDAGIPVYDLRTFERQLEQSLIMERLLAALSMVFAGLATALAAIGLYGLMSFTVARRTREIGIRMALGAPARHVLSLVFGDVARLVGIGVVVGVPIAVALGRLLESQLFAVSASDPITLAAAVVVMASVSLAASYVPARRAASVSPLTALRYE